MTGNERESAHFWRGCAEGRLLLQRCLDHGHLQYPPGTLCRRCASVHWDWFEACRRGRIEAFSLVTRPPVPAFAAYVPYMIVIVRLTEGPILETWLRIDGRTPEINDVMIGMPVRIEFATVDGRVLPIAVAERTETR